MNALARIAVGVLLASVPSWAHAAACTFTTLSAGPPKVIACTDTTATTWTVPSDWPHTGSGAKLEVIAGGGSGAWEGGSFGGMGGSGGCYSAATVGVNGFFTAGDSVSIQVGVGGTASTSGSTAGVTGGDSFVKDVGGTTRVLAKGGPGGLYNVGTGQSACSTSAGTGDTKSAGGIQGVGSGIFASGGGGGAAGPHGPGGNGSAGSGGNGTGGGGGNGGGGNAGAASGSVGGAGGTAQDGTAGGAGGTASTQAGNGSHGSGGGGSETNGPSQAGTGAGGNGIDWDATHGSGGGAGGTLSNNTGGAAGLYGGGSGGYSYPNGGFGVQQPGAQGILVVTYTPASGGSSTKALFRSFP